MRNATLGGGLGHASLELFILLAANWGIMVDSGGCCWVQFSALWSPGGGGEAPATPPKIPPSPNDGPVVVGYM